MAPTTAVVVGAGPTGIVAVKELKDAGITVECFERGAHVGGVFAPGNTYASCNLTVSNFWMCYSDYTCKDPWPPRYWTRGEYSDYMDDYCNVKGVKPLIKFHHTVTEVDRRDGAWHVKAVGPKGKEVSGVYNACVLATGAYLKAKLLHFKGSEEFLSVKGAQIVHSSEYQTAEHFKGRKVVIVGCGESGSDMAHDIANIAASATLVTRRHMMIAPRHPAHLMSGFAAETCDKETYEWDQINAQWHCLDGAVTRNAAMSSHNCHNFFHFMAFFMNAKFGKEPAKTFAQWNLNGWYEAGWHKAGDHQVITKNDAFIPSIICGKLKTNTTGVCHLTKNTVHFVDGACAEADTVLQCAGFEIVFPYMKQCFKHNPRYWWKHLVPPEFKNDQMCILGFSRPQQGGIPQAAEMQSRLFARLLTGHFHLPKDMECKIAKDAAAELDQFSGTPWLHTLVDYPRYMHDLASMVGCTPPPPSSLLLAPFYWKSWTKYLMGPMYCTRFRLAGPGAKPELVNAFLDKVWIDNDFPMTAGFTLASIICQFYWWVPGFVPKLWIKSDNSVAVPGINWVFPTALAAASWGVVFHGEIFTAAKALMA